MVKQAQRRSTGRVVGRLTHEDDSDGAGVDAWAKPTSALSTSNASIWPHGNNTEIGGPNQSEEY